MLPSCGISSVNCNIKYSGTFIKLSQRKWDFDVTFPPSIHKIAWLRDKTLHVNIKLSVAGLALKVDLPILTGLLTLINRSLKTCEWPQYLKPIWISTSAAILLKGNCNLEICCWFLSSTMQSSVYTSTSPVRLNGTPSFFRDCISANVYCTNTHTFKSRISLQDPTQHTVLYVRSTVLYLYWHSRNAWVLSILVPVQWYCTLHGWKYVHTVTEYSASQLQKRPPLLDPKTNCFLL